MILKEDKDQLLKVEKQIDDQDEIRSSVKS
jgi:hypothetical protein